MDRINTMADVLAQTGHEQIFSQAASQPSGGNGHLAAARPAGTNDKNWPKAEITYGRLYRPGMPMQGIAIETFFRLT